MNRSALPLVAFRFTHGPVAKPRPALIITISECHGDVLLAFISSNVSGPPGRDELDIPADHPGFSATGLKVSSKLRLSWMAMLAMPLVKRRIGVLPLALQAGCQQVLEQGDLRPRLSVPLLACQKHLSPTSLACG